MWNITTYTLGYVVSHAKGVAMTIAVRHDAEQATVRQRTRRRFLMCRPDHFEVRYTINPWMNATVPVDRSRALAQWKALCATYRRHGHQVDVIDGVPGQPDMVFSANGALVVGNRALSARFAHPERAGEAPAFHHWLTQQPELSQVAAATQIMECEGDFAFSSGRLLAGSGFRSSPSAHREVAGFMGLPVVSLELVDPRFYHLDTALMVLGDTIAYYPPAFSRASVRKLMRLFPDALVATQADAVAFGLNGVCDGRTVFLSDAVFTDPAALLVDRLRARGYQPVGIDVSEFVKSGGGVKCVTMEWHQHANAAAQCATHSRRGRAAGC